MSDNNPYLSTSFDIAWSQLTPELLVQGIQSILEQASSDIQSICESDNTPTFENSILALYESTEKLNQAWSKVQHLDNVANSPDRRKAYNEILPTVTSFRTELYLNKALWNKVDAFAKTDEASNLSPIRKRLLEETIKDFADCGAQLNNTDKEALKEINKKLAALTQKYAENLLDATNAWELLIDDKEQLKGLPESALNAAKQDAALKHKDAGKEQWRFTLQMPSYLPLMTYLDDRSIREQVWKAGNSVGTAEPHNNTGLVKEILELRDRKARLLGFNTFADYTTSRRMVKSGDNALNFIHDLKEKSANCFKREIEELITFRQEQSGESSENIEPWDLAYWSEKLRAHSYNFDDEDLRPYFPIDKVIEGLFTLSQKVFNFKITERNAEVWDPSVKYYDMHDADGKHLGSFYADWHPRESKRGGAWMNELKTGGPDGENWLPHQGCISGNMTAPVDGKTALLTHREVETIFHEFGHLIHHLLGAVELKPLNGINVPWDFVELPSQIMENWCWERESLDLFARHHDSGKCIPDELLEKMQKARTFQAAMAMMRQLSFGKMDLELHLHYKNHKEKNLDLLVEEMMKDYTVPFHSAKPSMLYRFSHLFADPTGYAAGYYSYKWAEVLEADAFTRFKNEGILNAATGMDFRNCILSKGNSRPSNELFRDFMGRDPELQPLLDRSGIN